MTRRVLSGLMVWLMLAGSAQAQVVVQGGIKDVVDVGNSSRANLNSINSFQATDLNSFTGAGFDTLGFAYTTVTVLASEQSSTNGLRFQWSSDLASNNFRTLTSYSILTSGEAYSFSFIPSARFFRLQYVNGGTKLRSLNLTTIHRGGGFSQLISIGGFSQVGIAAGTLVSDFPGANFTPQLSGLSSISTGFGNTALTSSLNTSWRGADLASHLRAQGSLTNGVQLNSAELVPGASGKQVVVYKFDYTPAALSSIGLLTAPGSGPTGASKWLASHYYAAQGGINNPPFGTAAADPGEYFRTSVGESLWGGILGSIGAHFNVLWSYKP